MEILRDSFDRPVPDNLWERFRKAPVAVCPLCGGVGVRMDGKHSRLCDVCAGEGVITAEKMKLLNSDMLEICKGFRCSPESESVPVNGTHKRTRKPEPA